MLTREIIRRKAMEYGADLVGFGDIRYYEGVDPQRNPLSFLPTAKTISFLIGSEGGLAEEEAALWQEHGIPAISLGKRILRTENAAAYVLPVLFYKSQTEV